MIPLLQLHLVFTHLNDGKAHMVIHWIGLFIYCELSYIIDWHLYILLVCYVCAVPFIKKISLYQRKFRCLSCRNVKRKNISFLPMNFGFYKNTFFVQYSLAYFFINFLLRYTNYIFSAFSDFVHYLYSLVKRWFVRQLYGQQKNCHSLFSLLDKCMMIFNRNWKSDAFVTYRHAVCLVFF